MEGVLTFLESSTIHGLTYISTTRKYVRLFWILVVITGFVGASFIIKESFESWSESPVKTTIETLPISDIKLPKMTVCPPKKTFTDFNYDLMMTENVTLTDELRDEMFKYAIKVINEDSFSKILAKLHEENRFYNWYYGYSMIQSPFNDRDGINYVVSTSATSGVVTTQYYGDMFQSGLVERKFRYAVWVYPPKSVRYNENVTLHFKLEKVSMTGINIEEGRNDKVGIDGIDGLNWLLADQTSVYTNFTPPNYSATLIHSRDVSSEDVEQVTLDVMPGFRLRWWYTGAEVTLDNKYRDNESKMTKHFVR